MVFNFGDTAGFACHGRDASRNIWILRIHLGLKPCWFQRVLKVRRPSFHEKASPQSWLLNGSNKLVINVCNVIFKQKSYPKLEFRNLAFSFWKLGVIGALRRLVATLHTTHANTFRRNIGSKKFLENRRPSDRPPQNENS